MTSDISY